MEPGGPGCLETGEGSKGDSSAGIRMQNWFSLNRHLRRSIYEKNRPFSEDDKAETQDEAERDPVVGEGCLLQLQPQPGPAAASGDPEAPSKAQADRLVPDSSASKAICPEAALPAPMPPEEIMALIQELQAAHEFQSSHFQERRQDLRSCHDCLKSMKTLKEHLQAVKARLWHVETMLGIQVPPQELDPEEEQEEPSAQDSPCDPDLVPAPPLV
ncbi:uncharacterized protein LOC120296655 isoform X1 [Crotalus tigris]|uniref:uncharacterized protein LOC120296655 isoform X1 n=1 Tax=Crotalus tigris TaxID=88082 RepID=UPI00192F478D|nr:uncharacterized protein LOC120296655 isoform X1 [Crotalus tigris]